MHICTCVQVLDGTGKVARRAAPYAVALAAALSAESPFVHVDSLEVGCKHSRLQTHVSSGVVLQAYNVQAACIAFLVIFVCVCIVGLPDLMSTSTDRRGPVNDIIACLLVPLESSRMACRGYSGCFAVLYLP